MRPNRPANHRQSGQAAVESALIVPMMVFIILGIVQLGMLHHARLMAEYAAYRAVRAGIVNHGDCKIMKNAAFVAVLPTLGAPPVGGGSGRVDTLYNAMTVYKKYTSIPSNEDHVPGMLPRIRLEVVNPKKGQLANLFSTYGSHMNGREIDYDDVRDDRVIEANLLSVRVTYFYEMRIPFANWLLHSFYMGRENLGDLKGIQFENKRVGGQQASTYLEARGASKDADHQKISGLATSRRKYVIPLVTTYSMRMQSNLFNNSTHGPGKCAVDS